MLNDCVDGVKISLHAIFCTCEHLPIPILLSRLMMGLCPDKPMVS